jgi:phospholipid transport system substrate-binding protein
MMTLGILAAQPSATDALKARDAEIRKALPPAGQAVSDAKKAKLAGIITQAVDMPVMARDSLGKRWDDISVKDRQRYVTAFTAFFKKASEGEIDSFQSAQIDYGNETVSGDDIQVPTTLTIKGEPTPVIYTIRKEASAFRIVDLTIDGVSTVDNYKSSFAKEVDKNGIGGLITKLQERAKKPVELKN